MCLPALTAFFSSFPEFYAPTSPAQGYRNFPKAGTRSGKIPALRSGGIVQSGRWPEIMKSHDIFQIVDLFI